MKFLRSRTPNASQLVPEPSVPQSPPPASSPHPDPSQGQYGDSPAWPGEHTPIVAPGGAYAQSVEDLTAVHRTSLGHSYVKIEEIRDIRGGRWVPHRKVVKPSDNSLFIAKNRTIQEDDPDTVFCVVEFKNETLTETVRDLVKDMETLTGSAPTARVQALFPYLEAFRERAAELKEQFERQTMPNGRELDSNGVAAVKEEFECLSSFLEFLENEWEPWEKKLNGYRTQGRIVFELIWALFKPGMKVKVLDTPSGEYTAARLTRSQQVEHLNERVSRNAIPQIWGPFRLYGEAVGWKDGKYTHVSRRFEIPRFQGSKLISTLPVVELKDEEMIEFQVPLQSEAYLSKHMLTCSMLSVGNLTILVMGDADIKEVLLSQHCYTVRGSLITGSNRVPAHGRAIVDNIPADESSNSNNYQRYSPPQSEASTPDPDIQAKTKANAREVALDELYLLPPTVPGFSLSLKRWGAMSVKELSKVEYSKEAWNHLVLDADTKRLIRSLVEIRGDKAKTEALASDWIQGKSEGLVFLLHGEPGLGKTLTAETVAETLERPLYMVGASELGINPHEVEEGLRRVLDRANSWNAVLLIDEADVLLEKRSSNDLARNALVAAALRLLEYHRGVLFLTTNRVQSFDPASLSRVSVAIKYTALDHDRRMHIWRQFLVAAKALPTEEEIAVGATVGHYLTEDDLKGLAEHDLNGRVIKNVVRTAQALALSADKPLGMDQLKVVINVTNKFHKEVSIPSARADAES